MQIRKLIQGMIGGIVVCVFTAATAGAEPIVYPAKEQSQALQQKDRQECQQWAVQETGVDPGKLAVEPAPAPGAQNRRPVLRGAARGAVVGGIGGSFGGEFGKGAAAGAAVGAVAGGVRRNRQAEMQHQASAAAQQQRDALLLKYDKAFGACMQGRGYTVQF